MLLFWVLLAVVGALYAAMIVLTVPVLLREAGGLKPLDFRPFGYSYQDVQTYLGTISEEGLATYLGLQQQLDLIYPLALAAMFITGFRRLLTPVPSLIMTVIAVAGAVADYSENALIATLLTEPATQEQVTLASAMTMAKSGANTLCFIVLIYGGYLAWRDRPAKKPVRRTSGKKSGKVASKSSTTKRRG